MNEIRYGDWMQVFSGGKIYPLDPRPEEIHLEDIAHALSQMNRYGGHTLFPYSVAQHCILLSYVIDPQYSFLALMHDASEAYLCDIPRPIKKDLTNYSNIENRLMAVIAKKFNFTWPMPEEVKIGDNRMITTERFQVMPKGDDYNLVPSDKYPAYKIKITEITAKQAKEAFINRFKELTHEK